MFFLTNVSDAAVNTAISFVYDYRHCSKPLRFGTSADIIMFLFFGIFKEFITSNEFDIYGTHFGETNAPASI